VLSFSHAYLSSSPVAVLAQPILDRLGEALHESSSLAMLDGDEIVYLARSTTSRIMSPSLNVGRRLPAYCTSIGLVLLAHLPPEEFEVYLGRTRFQRYTEHTPATPEQVRALVYSMHEKGYAYANQLMEPRICTMAVPVRDAGGHYVAGINVLVQGRLMSDAEMAERFLQPWQRAALPCVCVGAEIVAVGDLAYGGGFAAAPGEPSWRIVWHGRPTLTEGESTRGDGAS
jgi:IclR family pca regulon transcriptional regulator